MEHIQLLIKKFELHLNKLNKFGRFFTISLRMLLQMNIFFIFY